MLLLWQLDTGAISLNPLTGQMLQASVAPDLHHREEDEDKICSRWAGTLEMRTM